MYRTTLYSSTTDHGFSYTSEEATSKHTEEPHFKTMIATFEKEGILAKPPVVAKTSTIAGFDADKKLM